MKTIEERAIELWNNLPIIQDKYIKNIEDTLNEQKAIDIEKFKQWFTKWWESNEYLPLDVCLKSIDKAMEE